MGSYKSFNELNSVIETNKLIFDEFQCPLLDLSNCIYLSLLSHVLTPMSIVYSCSEHTYLKLNERQDRETEKKSKQMILTLSMTGVISLYT